MGRSWLKIGPKGPNAGPGPPKEPKNGPTARSVNIFYAGSDDILTDNFTYFSLHTQVEPENNITQKKTKKLVPNSHLKDPFFSAHSSCLVSQSKDMIESNNVRLMRSSMKFPFY